MGRIVDPYQSLVSFQRAYTAGFLTLRPGDVHDDLQVMMDDAGGEVRLTYAMIGAGGAVRAIVAYIPNGSHNGKNCFQVGYAVSALMRRKGIATETLRKSIDEMRQGFVPLMGAFYIEAIVGEDNTASLKVASKILSSAPTKIIDGPSGEPALQFNLLVE